MPKLAFLTKIDNSEFRKSYKIGILRNSKVQNLNLKISARFFRVLNEKLFPDFEISQKIRLFLNKILEFGDNSRISNMKKKEIEISF